ncbi:recombinase family protein [Aminobacter sp. UC22_36]|uniref:recombinase family protein n=1 Tax=Aminobacter sp. UC22_36 TaxID=3374549 RepID=UPI003757382C
MKVAIYARYSSDNQRDASIADQLRICRVHAENQGWQVVAEYTDHAMSGASLLRPGVQALIADGLRGRFEIVLAEAMDRLSRDQEDIAGLYKRMAYGGVKIVTLSEGEVTHLHVGLKGTMNALFLKDLADKTRRGQRGRVELGKSGGGNCYGYDVVKKLDANGEPVRGDRTINPFEAEVIRRIFRDYVAGKSPKRIAVALNKDGIRAPGGGDWGFSTLNGSARRGNGILNNEMYIGKLIWNRQRFVKDPDTGKRQARPNPESEWIIQHVPELRIVPEDLWDAAKARQVTLKLTRGDGGGRENHFRDRRRPRYLFSGLTRCGSCGGRLRDDLGRSARLFDGAQQRHLRQPQKHPPRPPRAARAQCPAPPLDGPGAVQGVLRRVHPGDEPPAYARTSLDRRGYCGAEADRA